MIAKCSTTQKLDFLRDRQVWQYGINLIQEEEIMKKFNLDRQWVLSGCVPIVLLTLFMLVVLPVSAYSADRLVINNGSGTPVIVMEDNGYITTGGVYFTQSGVPGFWLDETGSGHKGAYFVLDNNWMQVQRRAQGFGGYEAGVEMIHIKAPAYSLVIEESGEVGLGLRYPVYPLELANGAHCTAGGVWTHASSREYKKDIKDLTSAEAVDTLKGLNPVKFNYKASSDEHHVGFIAEDVPELVATKDRKGMSSMDVVAVLTKVVQEQQKTIAELSRKMSELERELKLKNDVAMVATDLSPSVVR